MNNRLTKARELSYDALIEIMDRKRLADEVAETSILKESLQLKRIDRGFIKEVLYGSLRWYAKILWILQKTSKRDLQKVSPEVRSALVMGAYQIFYMDRVPDRAAVNESAEYVRKKGQARAVGFVNGILRSIARRSEYFAKPDKDKYPAEYLALQYAHPKWIVDRWLKRFSFERMKVILSSNNMKPPYSIRINLLKVPVDHVQSLRDDLLRKEKNHSERKPLRSLLQLSAAPSLEASSIFQQGFYSIQDESSQLISYLVQPKAGELIFDSCAGRGTKLCQLYEISGGKAQIIGIEKNIRQLEKAKENLVRLGHENIELVHKDFLQFKYDQQPDKILVDAPCSGLGVIRRHPEGKWHKNSKIIGLFSKIQRQLLQQAISMVKVGGEVIFSVCSFEDEETIDQINWIKESFGDKIEIQDPRGRIPKYYNRFVTRDHLLLILAGNKEAMDGFGAFIIKKTKP